MKIKIFCIKKIYIAYEPIVFVNVMYIPNKVITYHQNTVMKNKISQKPIPLLSIPS